MKIFICFLFQENFCFRFYVVLYWNYNFWYICEILGQFSMPRLSKLSRKLQRKGSGSRKQYSTVLYNLSQQLVMLISYLWRTTRAREKKNINGIKSNSVVGAAKLDKIRLTIVGLRRIKTERLIWRWVDRRPYKNG